MNNIQLGVKILHYLHGPCEVTYVGKRYLGIFVEEKPVYSGMVKFAHHQLIRRNDRDYCMWRTWLEQVWDRDRFIKGVFCHFAWPHSTFFIEVKGTPHFMESHWEPFFAYDLKRIRELQKKIRRHGIPAPGYGEGRETPHQLPENCPEGKTTTWPNAGYGAALSLLTTCGPKDEYSLFPFWTQGSSYNLKLEWVLEWGNDRDAQIIAKLDDMSLTFFDTRYQANRLWYEAGGTNLFSLVGIAYCANVAAIVELDNADAKREQMEWRKTADRRSARDRRRKKITRVCEPEQLPESTLGTMKFQNVDNRDIDDYSFRGPIKEVTPFTDFLGQDGWVVKTSLMWNFDLDIIVTARTWNGETPPEIDQDIEGQLWLQGYLQDEAEP